MYGAGLWGLDYLRDNALHGGSGANFHGGRSPQFGINNGTLFYSPIDFGSTPSPTGVRGLYYATYLFTLASTGASHAATVNGGGNITAYGIGNNVIIVNKTTSALDATVTVVTTPSSAARRLV